MSPGGNRKNSFESHAFVFKHHDLSDRFLLHITTITIFAFRDGAWGLPHPFTSKSNPSLSQKRRLNYHRVVRNADRFSRMFRSLQD